MHTADPRDDSAPVARIDLAALRANAAVLIADPRRAVIDLRADAWGHGADALASTLDDLGVTTVLRDGDGRTVAGDVDEVDTAALLGLPGAPRRLRPVMSLTGSVLSVKRLVAGEGVSYGYRHRAAEDTRIALVTGGYAQGVVRGIGGRAGVLVAGRRHPIVGRVAMDVCVVDIGDADVRRGDGAVFFGAPERGEPDLADWTAATGLTAAEVTAVVGVRARRIIR